MIDFIGRICWLLFNVGVPVCAPFALLPLLSFSRFYRESSKGIAIRSVQNGQLLWVLFLVVASILVTFGAADSARHPDYHRGDEARERRLMWTSAIMTAAVVASFVLSHYSLN